MNLNLKNTLISESLNNSENIINQTGGSAITYSLYIIFFLIFFLCMFLCIYNGFELDKMISSVNFSTLLSINSLTIIAIIMLMFYGVSNDYISVNHDKMLMGRMPPPLPLPLPPPPPYEQGNYLQPQAPSYQTPPPY